MSTPETTADQDPIKPIGRAHRLAPYSTITEGCYLKYNPECPDGKHVSLSSEYVGRSPHEVSEVLGRPVYFFRPAAPEDTEELVVLDQAAINKVAAESKTAGEAVVGMYRQIHPDFDEIESFQGYPKCSKETWEFICQRFLDHDNKFHEHLPFGRRPIAAGAWMNSGFSTTDAPKQKWLVQPTREALLVRKVKI